MREREQRGIARAKVLRRRLTDAEAMLWSRLRPTAARGIRFRRQHPIGPFVVDFACVRNRLAIELDGFSHESPIAHAYDLRRKTYLKARGWHILRIRNEEVYAHLDRVLDAIFAEVENSEG